MAIEFFEEASAKGSRLPFVEDYVTDNPDDSSTYEVVSIQRTRKKTGYMMNTSKFVIFLFEESKVLSHVLEALAVWINTGKGYKFIVQLVDKDPFYKLGVDNEKPTEWKHSRGKYFGVTESLTIGSDAAHTQNPFLPIPRTGRHKKESPHPSTH